MKPNLISFKNPATPNCLALPPLPNKITQYILQIASEKEPSSFIIFLRTVSQSFRSICDKSYILSAKRIYALAIHKEISEKPILTRVFSNFIQKFQNKFSSEFLSARAFVHFVDYFANCIKTFSKNNNPCFFLNLNIAAEQDITTCIEQLKKINKHLLPIKIFTINALSLPLSLEILKLILKMLQKYGFAFPFVQLANLPKWLDLQLASMLVVYIQSIPLTSSLTIIEDTLHTLEIHTVEGELDLSQARVLKDVYINKISAYATVTVSGDNIENIICKEVSGTLDVSNAIFIKNMTLSDITNAIVTLAGTIEKFNCDYCLYNSIVDASFTKKIGTMSFNYIWMHSIIKTGEVICSLNFNQGISDGILNLYHTVRIDQKNLGKVGMKGKVINPNNL